MSSLGKPGIYSGGGEGSSQSGVLFRWPTPMQQTIYRTGDEGWRNQNGLLDFNPPAYPEAIADLDYSIGQNGWFRLQNDLQVGGVANNLRFVDVNGVQTWGAANNVNLITIDKLTGLGFLRAAVGGASKSWNQLIDDALTTSITVQGVVFDSFYMLSMPEAEAMFNYINYAAKGIDPISNKQYIFFLNDVFVSTTYFPGTTNAYMLTETWGWSALLKTNTTKSTIYVFDARSLISAP